jgi:multidrug transporter EmrE-like cation transporter
MSRSTQWLSLAGGILVLGYGIFKLFQPQHELIPMILGLLIIAFSISLLAKSRAGKEESDQRNE